MGYWKSHLQFPILFTLSTIYISINYLISVDYFGLDPGLANKYKKKAKIISCSKKAICHESAQSDWHHQHLCWRKRRFL